ncbi:MAG: CapA family protein [Candidatus Latescibacteria bacterium]|nr:CapA family protein [Candidatus Latescibacterota bacterium]
MDTQNKLGILFLFIIVIFAFFSLTFIFDTSKNQVLSDEFHSSTITIISVGDIFIHQSVLDAVYDKQSKSHDFSPYFQEVAADLQNADLATCWFGGVLDSVGTYTGYPSFKSPQALAQTMKNAGFDIAFRTNHTMDYGEKGLRTTTAIFNKYNIEQIGAYISEEQSRKIYVYEKDSLKVSFLSYTYGMNGIPIPKAWMVNLIDTVKIKQDIEQAKLISDFVIVALHFGEEYQRYPNQNQKRLVGKIEQYGANLIIGSHPHVIQPVERINNIYIAYCLGNFFCGQRMRYCDAGVMLKYTIVKEKDSVYLKEISYIPTWNAKYLEQNQYRFKILPITKNTVIDKENYPFLSDDNLKRMRQAYDETVEHLDKPGLNFICQ